MKFTVDSTQFAAGGADSRSLLAGAGKRRQEPGTRFFVPVQLDDISEWATSLSTVDGEL